MALLESVCENFDVNFLMKEFPADKQFAILVDKLKSMELLIDKKQEHKRRVHRD
jgi:hypothetical protein